MPPISKLSFTLSILIYHLSIGVGSASEPTPSSEPPITTGAQRQSSAECTSCAGARSRQRSPQEVQRDKLRLEQDKILSKLRLLKPPNVHLSINDLPSPLLKRLKIENDEFEKTFAKLDRYYMRTHNTHNFDDEQKRLFDDDDDDDERDDPLTAETKGVYIFGQRPRTGIFFFFFFLMNVSRWTGVFF